MVRLYRPAESAATNNPELQPPETSVAQCASRYTRLTPTSEWDEHRRGAPRPTPPKTSFPPEHVRERAAHRGRGGGMGRRKRERTVRHVGSIPVDERDRRAV